MPKEVIIFSDGTIENTVLLLDGERQNIFSFSFSANVDDIFPKLTIEPFIGNFSEDDGLNQIKTLDEKIADGKLSEYFELKRKELREKVKVENVEVKNC